MWIKMFVWVANGVSVPNHDHTRDPTAAMLMCSSQACNTCFSGVFRSSYVLSYNMMPSTTVRYDDRVPATSIIPHMTHTDAVDSSAKMAEMRMICDE